MPRLKFTNDSWWWNLLLCVNMLNHSFYGWFLHHTVYILHFCAKFFKIQILGTAINLCETKIKITALGSFLERPGNFTGPKSNIQIEVLRITARVLASKLHHFVSSGAPKDNFQKNICSEDDLRSRIFETFVVKFLACLPFLGFSNI